MNLQRFHDVSQAGDIESFERQLRTFAEHQGFPFFSAWLVTESPEGASRPEISVVRNAPSGFAELCGNAEDAQRDPVIQRLKRLSVPFVYDQALYVAEGAADLWETQAAYGYKHGINVALHLPGHRHFVLGVDRDEALPTDETRLARLMADLQLMAVHAQAAADRLLAPQQAQVQRPRLTAREMEILQWTRAGKSAWQTGVLLSISEATVNFHLRNLCQKLGVASKHQAVLRAIALGLLH